MPDTAAITSPALPEEWAEVVTPEGCTAIVPSPATRRLQTRVAAALAIAVFGASALFVHDAVEDHAHFAFAAIAVAAAIALGLGTVWLARGRNEWRIESGRLVLQQRFGDQLTEKFSATRLLLSTHVDSDGDDWFELTALTADADASEVGRWRDRARRKRIAHRMNDDAVPRRLGLWLAERARIALEDRTR